MSQEETHWARIQRDQLRYALRRAGRPDRVLRTDQEHQGEWTPGRVYLTGQHVWDPDTGDCVHAKRGGAPAGRRPGRSDRWWPCAAGRTCPAPEPTTMLPHPTDGLRAAPAPLLVGRPRQRWELGALADGHLLGVLDWLEDRQPDLWTNERLLHSKRVPCPSIAYETESDCMRDTPLWRALIEEKRRRHLRRPARRRTETKRMSPGLAKQGGVILGSVRQLVGAVRLAPARRAHSHLRSRLSELERRAG